MYIDINYDCGLKRSTAFRIGQFLAKVIKCR